MTRQIMTRFALTLALAVSAAGQAMIEHAAAAAGGSVGGVAGKKLSDGLNKVMGKVDGTLKGAADQGEPGKAVEKPAALLQVVPGSPTTGARKDDAGVVPPPPMRRAALVKPDPVPAPAPVVEVAPPPVRVVPPPPPEVTSEDLKKVVAGMSREDVLKLGPPSSRVTMFEDGHLLEIFRYYAKEADQGVLRLMDGTVSSIQIR
jgi:hypothetical protein